jgi:hypothetical protein
MNTTTCTAHILTEDIANPYAAVADQRNVRSWLLNPTFKKGTRWIVTRRDLAEDLEGLKPGCRFAVEIAPDIRDDDAGSTPSQGYGEGMRVWREAIKEVGTRDIAYYYEEESTDSDYTPKERARYKARVTLARRFMTNLSEPLTDYRSLFLQTAEHDGYRSADDILHQLYLDGAVSKDRIEQAIRAADAAARERALAERGVRS